uniref:Protein LONGIFOLIA 1 n=1 Tax=Noccaea caerulescens TaxID=107243 RepID=A0A1J3GH42_NOCCA
METRTMKEQALEKQIGGCMSGFFNIFDRPHLLSPKRFALPKRLSSSSSSPLIAESEPACSPLDSGIQKQQSVYCTPELRSPAPLTLPVMEFKQGSPKSPWRFSKEAPRLSLDSRAVVDAKGSLKPRQIRTEGGSPSVIARLMGLEALPTADSQQPLQRSASESRVSREYRFVDFRDEEDPAEFQVRSGRAQPARSPAPQRHVVRRKSFFDSADFFPEPRECGVAKMSKIDLDAPTSDLETLKQLLEALRLKGLLHSSHKPQSGIGNRSLVHESPIKPARPTFGIRSGAGESPSRRRRSENSDNRRPSPRASPLPWRKPEPVQTGNRTNRGGPAIEEVWKVDEYHRQGKTLLERCDKLLNSIAEMAAEGEAGESQPSPVSVLDASLYHEESSPSPVMKRSLDFRESEDESWGGSMSMLSVSPSSDSEYAYISDILRASDCIPRESDVFALLEKQQYRMVSAEERRLIFDAVQEIVGRRRRLPPWRMVGEAEKMEVIWSEFQKMRKKKSSAEEEDLVGYVCGVLGRDLSEDRWRDCEEDMSEAVLDIERLVFKDLIGETIRHLAALNRSQSHSDSLPRTRRLLFF